MPDAVLEDLERIEVVRARRYALGRQRSQRRDQHSHQERQGHAGGLVKAGGSFNEVITAARYGFKISEDTYARVYSSMTSSAKPRRPGGNSQDDWSRWRSGFRMDSRVDRNTAFTAGRLSICGSQRGGARPESDTPNYGTLEQLRFHPARCEYSGPVGLGILG